MSSEDARANGELDPRHLDLLRRYRDAMRDLLSLSRAEYAPRVETRSNPREEGRRTRDDDRCRDTTATGPTGPPLTPASVLYASLVVTPTRRAFSWAVPTTEAMAAVERHSGGRLLEMGAGTGFWTALLRARGNIRRIDAVDVAPCDGAATNGHHATARRGAPLANPPPFAAVRRGTPEDALETGPEDGSEDGSAPAALLLCWPPREEPDSDTPAEVSSMASRALERFRGDAVLYVGEPPPSREGGEAERRARAGATAGPVFHDALLEHWRCVESVPLPRWPGAADALTVWRRRARETPRVSRAAPDASRTPPPRDSVSKDVARENEAAAPRMETATTRETRRALLCEAREAWESATVAGIAARASRGGARAMRGAEQTALRAARRRSGVIRRLALAFL